MSSRTGPWGPPLGGGSHWRARRALAIVGVLALVGTVAFASVGFLLYRQADEQITRVPVDELTEIEASPDAPETTETTDSDARNFLVVGSDARSAEFRSEAGEFDGQRSDAILYVSLSSDRDAVSVISLPRDLLVERDGRQMRLGETFADGPGALVAAVQEEFGLPVHHYAKVTFDGFIRAVDTLGGVEICLEEELVDPDAGADLRAGCQRLDAEDALAFVRSRQGDRADLERIERQHRFLRATLDELTDRRLLADVPRLFDLVDDVAGHVTTDDKLSLPAMLGLADELRRVVRGGVPMTALPAYPETVGEQAVLRAYAPGAKALLDDVREGREIPDRGTPEEREETAVALWSGGRAEAMEIVGSTLLFGGFTDRRPAGPGPQALNAGSTTTIYAPQAEKESAERVAALLGAPVRELPDDLEVPEGADVVVAVGRDASGDDGIGDLPSDATTIETQKPSDD